MHLVLCHEGVGVGGALEWHELGQGVATDDHAGRVRGRIAGDALELARDLDELVDARVALDHLAKRRRDLERLVELDAELHRDGLGDAIHLAIPVAHDTTHVTDGRPRQHRAERDDLGDVVLAVLARDVVDDLVAPGVLEVHVDVGHRHAVRIEEALEGQSVEDGIDRRDSQRVRDDRSRRRAAAGRGDALLAGEAREVGHDEEVGGVAHRDDDAELVVEALPQGVGHAAVASFEAALALGAQPRLDGVAVRDGEVREAQLTEGHREVRHLRDAAAVREGVGQVREEALHLGGALEVELLGLETQPVRCVEVGPGAHAEQHVVGLGLLAAHVVEVVRGHEREARVLRQAQQLGIEGALLGQAVILELEEEVVATKDVGVLTSDTPSRFGVVDLECAGDLAAQAGRQADEALAVACQQLTVQARLVVVAVQVRRGDDATEVLVAGPVLGEEHEV